jgi:diguanylate cyclase (GGDEF)-like protein/hemerythrin-like metal-binding protein
VQERNQAVCQVGVPVAVRSIILGNPAMTVLTQPHSDLLARLQGFPAPLATVDQDGVTITVNQAFVRRYGPASIDGSSLNLLLRGDREDSRISLDGPLHRRRCEVRALALRVRDRHVVLFESGAIPSMDDEVAQLREHVGQLERIAATDHLTGTWNRAQFDRFIEAETARSASNHRPLSLVLLDIDHFKSINDTFGHAAGDGVLREFAALAQAQTRRSDHLFRWGGEEFALLLPDSGYRSAERVAEKVRQAVESHRFATVGSVRLSAGVAERLPDEATANWFERLDHALYDAKRNGRNRVVVDRRGIADEEGRLYEPPTLMVGWREEFESGNPTIDLQHRELLAMANELLRCASSRDPQLLPRLEDLIIHVRRHFSDEEAILELCAYPGLRQHKRHHQQLVKRAGRLHRRAASGDIRFGEIVEYLVREVILGHMMSADREFFSFLK